VSVASNTAVYSPAAATPLSRASSALSWAILLGGIATIGVTLHMVTASYSSLPFWDGWIQIAVVANGESPISPAWLWRPHVEHRLPIPKLFLAADLSMFHARQTFLLASILTVQFLHWLLLSWSMRAQGNWRGPLWRTGTGLAAFCLFCPSQFEIFTLGSMVWFVLPGLFVTLAFVSLLLYWTDSQREPGQRRSTKFLVLSILAALAANYSLSNGNLLWPLLVAAALLLRVPLSAALSFAITGLFSIVLYFHNYVRLPWYSKPLASPERAAAVLAYLATYFGSSWVWRSVVSAEIIGAVALLVATLVLVRAPSFVRTRRRFALQLVFTIAFCLAGAMITSTIRLNFGVAQAFASRYQVFALLFWCCLGLLLLGSDWLRARPAAFLVVQVCVLLIFIWGAHMAKGPIFSARGRAFDQNVAAASMLTGAIDRAQLEKVYPGADYILPFIPYMREHHLSVFSTALVSQLGKPLDVTFPGSTDDCTGVLESVAPVEGADSGALRISGWAYERKGRREPLEVVATRDGVITGLAAVGERRPDIRKANPWLKSSYVGFAGYAINANSQTPLKFYAILDSQPPAACYFATR
jgi:hypothetical protein